jgi:hypothetical protein
MHSKTRIMIFMTYILWIIITSSSYAAPDQQNNDNSDLEQKKAQLMSDAGIKPIPTNNAIPSKNKQPSTATATPTPFAIPPAGSSPGDYPIDNLDNQQTQAIQQNTQQSQPTITPTITPKEPKPPAYIKPLEVQPLNIYR